jgi:hypothetical protein
LTPDGSSTHLHTNSTQNTENGKHIKITKKKIGKKFTEALILIAFYWKTWALAGFRIVTYFFGGHVTNTSSKE